MLCPQSLRAPRGKYKKRSRYTCPFSFYPYPHSLVLSDYCPSVSRVKDFEVIELELMEQIEALKVSKEAKHLFTHFSCLPWSLSFCPFC